MKKTMSIIKSTIIFAVVILLFSCNPIENDTRSASLLYVEEITGTDIEDNEQNFLQSDVAVESGEEGQVTVEADLVSATLGVKTINPEPIYGTSQYNNVILTRYVVTYTRSDGKNTEGVDVPYSFEGSLSSEIAVGSTQTISIVVVRAVAKLESPLIDLRDASGDVVLTVTAKVDFYGHDLADRAVSTTGYITIYFANYVND
ncbi:MAG: hypothetical protein J7L72_07585 [Candidatus Aminicenantes bacterium]|nr:hypothetical protein [Candidatus Aminicenantes bacterium]HHF52715.1 hypothetical protein [Candidatus Aminicenantes bacterium]